MSFLADVCTRASKLGARVAFGEASDQRVLDAATRLEKEGVASPILVVDTTDSAGTAKARATGLECIDPSTDPRKIARQTRSDRRRSREAFA
jgi:phosphotransacetylase